MPAMATVLTEFADNGNSRTYTYAGHTAAEPRLVIQRRKVATTSTAVAEDVIQVISSTEDTAGELLDSRVLFEIKKRHPVNGIAADLAAALVIVRDIVASDEYTNTVSTQEWLK